MALTLNKRLPQVIQDVNVFINGLSYLGVVKTLKLPNIEQETIEVKGAIGGKFATGTLKTMEMSFKLLLADVNLFVGMGLNTYQNRIPLVFKASVYDADTGKSVPLVAGVTGDFEAISPADLESGKEIEVEVKIAVHFYNLNINNVPMIILDVENMICMIGGVDYLSSVRSNLQ